MSIAKRWVTHVCKLDVTFWARVHEKVALRGMEFRRSDDLCQLLHIDRFDIHNVYPEVSLSMIIDRSWLLTETLVADIEIPKINS